MCYKMEQYCKIGNHWSMIVNFGYENKMVMSHSSGSCSDCSCSRHSHSARSCCYCSCSGCSHLKSSHSDHSCFGCRHSVSTYPDCDFLGCNCCIHGCCESSYSSGKIDPGHIDCYGK